MAIKVLNLDTIEDEVKDVQQEITLLSQLTQAHVQNVTRYQGSFLQGSKLWIIMDYCSGGSINTLLKAGTFEEKYSAVIIREVLVALQYIHKEGIIHRDIKAANILVTKEGRVQLCDFGVAARLTTAELRRTSMIGTPYWMAPEVIQEGAAYNQKADIWSLGVTLYEMTTGFPPFSEQDPKRAVYLIPRSKPARLEGTQYSAALKEVVARCLDEQPEERATAEDLSRTRFIKNTKSIPTTIIRDLIGRYIQWRAKNLEKRESLTFPNTSDDEEEDNDAQDFWNFDDSTPPPSNFSTDTQFYQPGSNMGSSTPGSQLGTLTNGLNISLPSPLGNHFPPDTFKEGYTLTETSDPPSVPEKHPLMELFEADESKEEIVPSFPILPLSTNASSVNLTGLANLAPMNEFNSSSMISLDLPAVSPYVPVSIDIPSFDGLESHPKISPMKTVSGAPTLQSAFVAPSASSPSLPDLANGKGRMVMPGAVSPVTPHTPIKPVFSQPSLSQMIQTAKSSQFMPSHGTSGSSTRRTSSPNRGVKPGLASPNVMGSHTNSQSTGTRVSSQNSQRTLVSQSSLESPSDPDEQISFNFNKPSIYKNEKPRTVSSPLSRTSSHTSLANAGTGTKASQNDLFKKAPIPTRKLSGSSLSGPTVTDQSLYLAMPPSYSQPIALQPPPKPSNGGLIRDSGDQSHLLQQNHPQQQQQKEGSLVLDTTAVQRTLVSKKQYIVNQKQKSRPPALQEPSSNLTIPMSSQSLAASTPRFPKLVPLDSNVLLDSTSKDEAVAHLDALLASFMSGLDVLEQDLLTTYL